MSDGLKINPQPEASNVVVQPGVDFGVPEPTDADSPASVSFSLAARGRASSLLARTPDGNGITLWAAPEFRIGVTPGSVITAQHSAQVADCRKDLEDLQEPDDSQAYDIQKEACDQLESRAPDGKLQGSFDGSLEVGGNYSVLSLGAKYALSGLSLTAGFSDEYGEADGSGTWSLRASFGKRQFGLSGALDYTVKASGREVAYSHARVQASMPPLGDPAYTDDISGKFALVVAEPQAPLKMSAGLYLSRPIDGNRQAYIDGGVTVDHIGSEDKSYRKLSAAFGVANARSGINSRLKRYNPEFFRYAQVGFALEDLFVTKQNGNITHSLPHSYDETDQHKWLVTGKTGVGIPFAKPFKGLNFDLSASVGGQSDSKVAYVYDEIDGGFESLTLVDEQGLNPGNLFFVTAGVGLSMMLALPGIDLSSKDQPMTGEEIGKLIDAGNEALLNEVKALLEAQGENEITYDEIEKLLETVSDETAERIVARLLAEKEKETETP